MLLFHSITFHKSSETWFVFGLGTSITYAFEFALVHIASLYSYRNLPISLFEIPLVIPFGWVVTFYGISELTGDGLEKFGFLLTKVNLVTVSGLIGIFFGLGIEVLARNLDFWEFNFESYKIGGIPVLVALVWGVNVAIFTLGREYAREGDKSWILVIVLYLIANTFATLFYLNR